MPDIKKLNINGQDYNVGGGVSQKYVDQQDAEMLASANRHSDSGDANTLSAANQYADTRDAETLEAAKKYSDGKLVTIEIEDRGGNNFWTRPVTTANQIIDMVNAGKEVRLSFYDTITNTGDQLYPYENTRQSVCYFRRNVITEDKISRISWGVQFNGSIVAQEIVPALATNATQKVDSTLTDIISLETFYTHFYNLRKSQVRRYQFEYTQNGIHQNIVDAIGLPPEFPVSDKGFIYVDLPYSEAGGFMIAVTLEGRSNGQLWRQEHWATLNSTWHKSEWVDQTKQSESGPSTAAELAAVVPADMPPETEANTQAVLNAAFERSMHLKTYDIAGTPEDRYTLVHNVSWRKPTAFRDWEDRRIFGYFIDGKTDNFSCGDSNLPLILKGRGVYQQVGKEQKEIALKEKSVQLPDSGHGAAGQFAVSDGKGGIDWLTLVNRSEVGA